jgi:hypothetical protein
VRGALLSRANSLLSEATCHATKREGRQLVEDEEFGFRSDVMCGGDVGDALGTGQIITALTGVGGVLVGSLISWGVQTSLLGRRIAADKVLATDKFEFDKELAEKRFRYDRELAERKFAQEREQLVFKRQFELAESLLADAYRFRGLIRDARIGGSFGGEGTTRKSEKEEPQQVKEAKDMYYVPVERLRRDGEFFAAFFAKQFMATAQFGPKVKESFDIFSGVINRIMLASGMLNTMVDQPSVGDHKVKDELLDDLWAARARALGREDKIEAQIEQAVATLESVCRPVLERTAS